MNFRYFLFLFLALFGCKSNQDINQFRWKREGVYNSVSVTLLSNSLELLDLYNATHVAMAVYAVYYVWPEQFGKERVREKFKHVYVVLADEKEFRCYCRQPSTAAGACAPQRDDIVLIVIPQRTVELHVEYFQNPMYGGEPVIHEAIHHAIKAVAGYPDYYHSDSRLWETFGYDTIQWMAQRYYDEVNND